jgi:hypothetical protein
MDWFSAHWIFDGRLTLFALALQLYLSFGHIHSDDIYGPVGGSLDAAETVVLPSAESVRTIPAGQPWYDDDALCPICETRFFLSTSFAPEAPQILPLPSVVRPVEHSTTVAAFFIAPRRAAFHSRAPPLV